MVMQIKAATRLKATEVRAADESDAGKVVLALKPILGDFSEKGQTAVGGNWVSFRLDGVLLDLWLDGNQLFGELSAFARAKTFSPPQVHGATSAEFLKSLAKASAQGVKFFQDQPGTNPTRQVLTKMAKLKG